MQQIRRRLGRIAMTCAVSALVPSTVNADPLGTAAIAKQVKKGWLDWHSAMEDSGWTGLQPRIDECYGLIKTRPSQEKTVYCATLDHLTLLDTLNFPANLRPAYFGTDAVFARLDKAVAQSTPKADRRVFESRLLSTMDQTIHQMNEAHPSSRKKES